MKVYRRIAKEERLIIETMLREGRTQMEIAKKTGFSQSAISREIAKNSGQRGYRHKQAGRMHDDRRAEANKTNRVYRLR